MKDLDHPAIVQAALTGYANMVAQPEHAGIDFFQDEILVGDEIVLFKGETILKSNLENFLAEELGFEFKTAE
jgi:hypothetical protein